VRIGSVPYLNAKPLIAWFQTPEGERSGVEVVYDVPSRLARMVEAGEVACAMASSVELFRHADWKAVQGIAIASTGTVLSVRLFSKVPVDRIRSLALDTSSLTSSALVQVLFARWWQVSPRYIPLPPDLDRMLEQADAALLIGDKGMLACSEGLFVTDLGEEWYRWTGLPFVWALWLGRAENITPPLVDCLHRAREWGLAHLESIVQQEATRLNIDESLVRHYLCDIMQYAMTDAHEQALNRFAHECKQLGLV
jgi:chorismate dehydratase